MKSQKTLLPLWIIDTFPKVDVEEIFSERCSFCGKSFLQFLIGPQQECPACDEPFTSLAASLDQLHEQKRSPSVKSRVEPAPKQRLKFPWAKKSPPDPKLLRWQVKERLDALIHDERYEEARKVAEGLNKLESTLRKNQSQT